MNQNPLSTGGCAACVRGRLAWAVRAAMAAVAIGLLSASGCGKEAPPAAVEGTLRIRGQPLDNCLIEFLPTGDRGRPVHTRRRSRTTGAITNCVWTISGRERRSVRTSSWFKTFPPRPECAAWTTAPRRTRSRAARRRPSVLPECRSDTPRNANPRFATMCNPARRPSI